MAKKSSPSKSKKKGAGKKPVAAPPCHDVTIEVGDKGVHVCVGYRLIWTNHQMGTICAVEFRDADDGCPLNICKFAVPAATASGPGTYPTKVVKGSGGHSFRYHTDCRTKLGGIPTVIVD